MIPLWVLIGLGAVGLGLVVGFQIYAPRVVREFENVIHQSSNNTIIFDAEDNVLAAIEGNEDRHSVPISRIHPYLQKAVVAIEDRRFFAHRGMDPVRLVGAVWADLKAMAYEQGASTITQQLIKLTLLSSERSLSRKAKEMFMAVALEQNFSKLKVLELYLNRVYLGNGLYGVEKASRVYFHKSAAELELHEAALLAALVKKPEGYLRPSQDDEGADSAGEAEALTGEVLPLNRLERLTNRQRLVLESLQQLGWVSDADYKAALKAKLVMYRPEPGTMAAPYFVQQALKEARAVLGVEGVSGRGYRIYTSLRREQQKVAEALVAKFAARVPEGRELALIALHPFTGQVSAMVGGVDHSRSQFNRAVQARRQPGSAFKPILYAAALENGFAPNTVFVDEPVRYTWDDQGNYHRLYESDVAINLELGTELSPPDNPESVYSPRNYDNRYGLERVPDDSPIYSDRRMTMARALEVSSNVIAVQLLDKLGMQPLLRSASRWGLPLREDIGLCVALGCSEVSLSELTAAYATFANNGLRVEPTYIRRITNSSGDLLYEHFPPPPVEVLSPWSAFQMRNLLQGVLSRGTGWRARLGRPSGGKTGTNEGPRDAWFVGFTPDLVAGVWVGHDDNQEMPGEAGGVTPAKVWRSFMKSALPPYNGEDFPEPTESYVGLRICNLDGRLNYTSCPDSSVQYFRKNELPDDLLARSVAGGLLDTDSALANPEAGTLLDDSHAPGADGGNKASATAAGQTPGRGNINSAAPPPVPLRQAFGEPARSFQTE